MFRDTLNIGRFLLLGILKPNNDFRTTRARNGVLVKVGQTVDIIPSMGVEGVTRGVISSIDGDILIVDLVINGATVPVERYGCEIIA